MNFDLNGKVSLVTGACRGIGKACAEVLAQNGSNRISICCRHKTHIKKTAEVIRSKSGCIITPFVADIAVRSDVKNMVQTTLRNAKQIDFLVINTGTPSPGYFTQCSTANWVEGINLCLSSAIYLCREVIPTMKKHKFGRIIILTSIFAKEPDPGFVISSTVRSSLLTLTKCLARELAPFNITVNAICQGFVDTPLLREVAEEQATQSGEQRAIILNEWQKSIPLKRFAKPEEIGHLVAFLTSEQGSYITGTAITVDGGVLRGI